MDSTFFMFGAAQVNITPTDPIPLAGFAYRNNQSFSGIASDICLKAFVFRVDDVTKCLLIADVLWWPPELIDDIRTDVQRRWGISAANLMLHATHTHSAPQTSSQFTPGLGLLHGGWQEKFLESIHDAIALALDTLQMARISRYQGQSHASMNRRVDKGVDRPTEQWPKGMIDRDLTTLLVQGVNGEPLGALVHYACHPTILRGAEVSAEFPGVLCDHIAQHLGDGCIVGFLQGCSGDVGPIVELSGAIENSSYQEVERIGNLIATDVIQSLGGEAETVIPDATSGHFAHVALPFEHVPAEVELREVANQSDYIGEWAKVMLDRPMPLRPDTTLEIQQLSLGTDLTLVAFNAEMVAHYGLLVKSLSNGNSLPCAYSNGMVGYVITDDQLDAGGYEADESTKYFALPSRFACGNQHLIEQAIKEALRTTP